MFPLINMDQSRVNYFRDNLNHCEISTYSTVAPLQATVESMHFYSTEEFYNHNNENLVKFGGHQYITSYKSKSPRDKLKNSLKNKRKRTMFTTEQIVALEEVFHKKPYINREERFVMMKRLQISEKSIKVWFQNRRRLTDKMGKEYNFNLPSLEDVSESYSDRLTMIESNIKQNTDVYGYVRLDTNTMTELVNVIDEYLAQDPITYDEDVIPPVSDNKVIYEPISPASSTDSSEEIDARQDIQILSSEHLTDIQSFLFF